MSCPVSAYWGSYDMTFDLEAAEFSPVDSPQVSHLHTSRSSDADSHHVYGASQLREPDGDKSQTNVPPVWENPEALAALGLRTSQQSVSVSFFCFLSLRRRTKTKVFMLFLCSNTISLFVTGNFSRWKIRFSCYYDASHHITTWNVSHNELDVKLWRETRRYNVISCWRSASL